MTSATHAGKKQPSGHSAGQVLTITFASGQNGEGVVPPGSVTTARRILFAGNAGNLERIQMYDGSAPIGNSTAANEVGFWEFIAPTFASGAHSITVRSLDAGGISNEWPFTVK